MTNTSSIPVTSINKPHIAPRNDVEESLVAIWAEILKVDAGTIGIDDGLFVNSGANSLVVIQLIARIAERFKVEMLLADVFAHPTISQLALIIQNNERINAASTTGKSA